MPAMLTGIGGWPAFSNSRHNPSLPFAVIENCHQIVILSQNSSSLFNPAKKHLSSTLSDTPEKGAPVRLLFVSHTFPPLNRPLANVGGMQRVATELHDALYRNAGLQLHSLTLRSSWRWLAVQTPLFLFRSLLQLERLSQHRQIDAVLFSSLLSAAFILPFARHLRACGAITAAIAHGQDVTGLYPGYQSLVRQGLRRLDQVILVSRATGQACVERGLEEARLQVISNGVDLRRFPPHPPSAAARRQLQSLGELPAGAFLLVSVGRHVARKGFLWFVEHVMPSLPGNIHYWLAGRGPDSSKILHAAACRGLSSRVHLVGPLGEKRTAVALPRGRSVHHVQHPGTRQDGRIRNSHAGSWNVRLAHGSGAH